MPDGIDWLKLLPLAIYTTDPDGRITFYNQAAVELWGGPPEPVSYWNGAFRLLWPDGSPMAHDECPMAVALKKGEPPRGQEAIAERRDGSRVRFLPHSSLLRDDAGKITGAINLLTNVEEQYQHELEAQRLAAIVADSDDAIVSKTLSGIVTSWNAAAVRLFGYSAEEMIGQSILRIIPPDLHYEETRIIAQLQRGEHVDHYETVRLAKDGRRVDISLSVSPLRDRSGRVVGASKIARDVSERRRAEELQWLLIEELNHRVKNTLATVQAIATQSLSHAKTPADFVPGFSGRVQALARAHDLLMRARLQGVDVMELVREQVLYGCADDSRIACSGPALTLDPQTAVHLALVLHELATNARKYGALSVPQGRLSVVWETQANDGQILQIAWDERDGPQVAAPQRRGFGSTLIERTLKAHGGEAALRYGSRGVSARIRLPLPDNLGGSMTTFSAIPASESALMPNQTGEPPVLLGKRVIVIDDEPLIAMDVEAMLTSAGCEIVGGASTLMQAKALVADVRCDAALVDVNLSGHSVEELAVTLTRRNIPFAFVTGHGRDALPRGFQDAPLVRKPFSRDGIVGAVEKLVGPGRGVVPLRRKPA
jgi:PAS domain S-box-containing protein